MSSFLQGLVANRQDVIRLLAAVFALGVLYARMPTTGDIQRVNDNLAKILAEQRKQIDRHELDIAARLTRAEVREMLSGADNPWTIASATVMPAVHRYLDFEIAGMCSTRRVQGGGK